VPSSLLADDPLGRHDQLAAPSDNRDLIREKARAGEAAAVVPRSVLERGGIGVTDGGRTLSDDATLMDRPNWSPLNGSSKPRRSMLAPI
jgi:hypothetical protein